MKYAWAVCLMLLLFAAGAAAQVGGALSYEPNIVSIPSHPGHASRQPLGNEQSLLYNSSNTSAKGERPLWETPQQVTYVMPLGDVARLLRKEHESVKKAVMVKEN